jgi:ribosomal protein L37E
MMSARDRQARRPDMAPDVMRETMRLAHFVERPSDPIWQALGEWTHPDTGERCYVWWDGERAAEALRRMLRELDWGRAWHTTGKAVMAFTCPRCGIVSHNPEDERQRYCARCHVFTDDPSPCCDAPLELAMGWAPETVVTVCSRCGQVYRPDGQPEGRWRFPRRDQHGRMVKPLRPAQPR